MWGSRKFYFGDNISVGVKDLHSAIAWYQEKLGLKLTAAKSEDFDAFLALSRDDEVGLALVRMPAHQTSANVEPHPILFTKKVELCRQDLAARGVQVGPIQRDSGGNVFFQFQDSDGNTIEVCVEP
jgi:catechol 2,3-dioxygenase-like lactoylglutathione lyase family enzyme